MTSIYPPPSLQKDGFINVSKSPPHTLYWQEYGNKQGSPVLLLHGGPGSGTMQAQAQLFDPQHFRIIMFDQRGAGKSTPHACIEANTTEYLVDDINLIRDALQVTGKMHLFGGSWGSTLALTYSIAFPQHVASLTLYGVFLGRYQDISNFYQSNATALDDSTQAGTTQQQRYKEWHRYVTLIPKNERHKMLEAYHRLLTHKDSKKKLQAAQYWNRWERSASSYLYDEDAISIEPDDHFSLAHACIENHYFRHGLFLSNNNPTEQNHILDNICTLANIPMAIIQGEHDHVCPKDQALALYEAMKVVSISNKPMLYVIEKAGHTMHDPGMKEAIVNATNQFRSLCY